MAKAKDELREDLAEYAHEVWSGWMKYMLDDVRSFEASTGIGSAKMLVLRNKWVERWRRLMNTSYADLSESEKQSDREEADKMLEIISYSEVGKYD